MEALLSLLNEDIVYQFLLLFARIVSFVAFMPVFGHPSVNANIRIALAFYTTIFLFPLVDLTNSIDESSLFLGLLSEITLGFIAALFFNIIFLAVGIIGDFVSYATGLSMAMMFNPATGSQEGLIARMLFWTTLALFFQTGMYELTIVLLAKSFSMIHLGSFNPFSYEGIYLAIVEINRMFTFAFSFALPLFFIGLVMDIYYGYGTKSMPSFSPFVITFQMKFTLIFLFLMFGLEMFAEALKDYFILKFQ